MFEDLNAWAARAMSLASGGTPLQVDTGVAAPGFLPMLGFGHPLTLGRVFTADEGTPGRDQVVILSHSLWQERFGGDRGILGRAIRLDGKPYEVVGILGAGPGDNIQHRLWVPLTFPDPQDHGSRFLSVLGRLKAGVTVEQANANLAAIAARMARALPRVEPGLDGERRAVPQQLPEPRHHELPLAAARRRRLRAADRLRQRRQPAAGPRHRPPARDHRAHGAGRVARRDRAAAAGREPRAGRPRRRLRRGPRGRADARGRGRDAAVHAASRDRDRAQRSGAALHRRGVRAVGHHLRPRAGLAGGPRRSQPDVEGSRARRPRRAAWPAPGPRGPRVRAGADAADRRWPRPLQLHDARSHRAGLPDRAPPHLRAADPAGQASRRRRDHPVLRRAGRAGPRASGRGVRGRVHRPAAPGVVRVAVRGRGSARRRPEAAAERARQHGHRRVPVHDGHRDHAGARHHRPGSRRHAARRPGQRNAGPAVLRRCRSAERSAS